MEATTTKASNLFQLDTQKPLNPKPVTFIINSNINTKVNI